MSKALADLASLLDDVAPVAEALPVSKKDAVKELSTKADKFAALKVVEKQLNKQLDTTLSIVRLGSKVGKPVPSIPTNLPTLDNEVFGCGGVPRGRLIEIFGPESSGKTTLCLHIIAQEQKNTDNLCAVVDAEHALDPTYAAKLGVNVDELLISQPSSGEDALETVEALIDSRAVSLIVVDSVAALVPRAELDGEMGDAVMGLQARLMSQACRKLIGKASANQVTVIFVNQLRDKIGVMFGCFSYNTRVMLEDGTTEKIGKIVNQKLNVSVLSMDPETGTVSSKPVIDWHNNGNTDDFIRIDTTNGLGRNGKSTMVVTPNHLVFTPSGEAKASSLAVGDKVLGLGKITFSDIQFQVAVGSILGDGNLRKSGVHNTTLRILHGAKQKEYAQYKASIYGNMLVDAGYGSNGSWGFQTTPSYDLTSLYNKCYSGVGTKKQHKKRHLHSDLLDNLTLRGLAIWYMDDGNFCGSYARWGKGKSYISAKTYSVDELVMLADTVEKLGVPRPTIGARGRLLWSSDNAVALHTAIAQYIHPSMEYKIHPSMRGRFNVANSVSYLTPMLQPIETTVTKVEPAKVTKSKKRFDLTVEDSHTYFVDGIAVHNSPETTTGGKALKFYASVRLDVRRKDVIGDKTSPIGHQLKVKSVKNKMAAPMRETVINLLYDSGIDTFSDFISYAIKLGALKQSGPWVKFGEKPIASGLTNTVEAVRLDQELFKQIKAEVERIRKEQTDVEVEIKD
jgi:recombination protein RecA